VSHLLVLGGSPAPALVLGCLAGIILWGRFATVKAWLGALSAKAKTEPRALGGVS
jgi:hypothetical protein